MNTLLFLEIRKMFTRLSQQTTMCWEQPNGNKSLGQKLDKQQDFLPACNLPALYPWLCHKLLRRDLDICPE